ncbi:hydrogenase maturation factor [Burkholderia arboris]|uniref:hydrogenase maturation factor n=1 Tax=Burkholderia TaxID=32008 RepID=UPI001CA3A500|nr:MULTISPECIES: hydrogenase maturation factor [Burkholderia]MBY8609918.1 hydrogenase maturation factor [Burkholderia arboris]MDN7492549.1 hydrogenase maturation factor [Burkholderia sp. AU45274]
MDSAYTYRGYTIDVRCEYQFNQARAALTTNHVEAGFVAVVQVRATAAPSFFLTPIRLADDRGMPFVDGLEALRAGRSAGEIIIDDLLVDVERDSLGAQ